MADTAIGMPMARSGNDSEWDQFDFAQAHPVPEMMGASIPGSMQQPLGHELQFDSQNYVLELQGMSYDLNGQTLPPQVPQQPQQQPRLDVQNVRVGEHGELVNQPRITTAQQDVLERAFTAVPHPKAEYKRSLADTLRMDPARVNQWFHVRRQRAKANIVRSRKVSDDASVQAAHAVDAGIDMRTHGVDLYSQGQLPVQDYKGISNNALDDFNFFPDGEQSHQAAMGSTNDRHASVAGPFWVQPLETSEALAHQFTSDSLFSSHDQFASEFDFANSKDLDTFALIGTNWDGPLDSHSLHTLNSNASSVGESNNLMTPPTMTPPIPWLTQEADTRRVSDSSELAHNVEGMHLHHAHQAGSSIAGNSTTSTSFPTPFSVLDAAVTPTALETRNIADEQPQAVVSPSTDLATRRKRSRPPPLRPEANRSVSCGGPLSATSPHSRNGSISVGTSNAQLRRIQSQGQFRIQKPSKASNQQAQLSPHHLQSHFEKQTLLAGNSRGCGSVHSNIATPSPPNKAFREPSLCAASADRSVADYQSEFHIGKPAVAVGWPLSNSCHHANSSVPNLPTSSSGSQNFPSLSIQTNLAPDQPLPGPPLSAPPNQTTFGDTSSVAVGPYQPPGWPGSTGSPSSSQAFHQGSGDVSAQSNSSYLPPFAPSFQFPQEGSPHAGNLFAAGLAAESGSGTVSPASSVELEFQVKTGPQPRLSSKFDKVSFHHVFSNKYPQNGEKK